MVSEFEFVWDGLDVHLEKNEAIGEDGAVVYWFGGCGNGIDGARSNKEVITPGWRVIYYGG